MKISKILKNTFLLATVLGAFISCDDNNTTEDGGNDDEKVTYFNISAKFDDDDTEIYIAPVTSLDQGSLTFLDNGMKLDAVRSARVMANSDNVYNFNYGGGLLYQYKNNSDGLTYSLLKELDLTLAMGGQAYVRPAMINDETILVHNIVRETVEDITDTDTVKTTTSWMYVTNVAIPATQIAAIMTPLAIPATTWDVEEEAYVYRVDVPTVLDDKIYYGVGRKSNYDEITPSGMHTIVMDYPSLKNPTYIRSTLGNGNTNGYRGPNAHAIDGYVYQANNASGTDNPTVLLRLKDGTYDNDYVFDISTALGEGAIYTNNWYHVGNGIAYMSFAYQTPEDADNAWGVARIDIHNKTAVKMDVPLSDLFQYQSGVVNDGKFYMAICPTGGEAYVYGFDIDSDKPDAVSKGIKLDEGNIFIQGIY